MCYYDLFCEAADGEGDWEADDEHVDAEAQEHVLELIRAASVKSGERQDNVAHDQLDGHAVEQATNQRMLNQEAQLATGGVIDGGDGCGDEVVQQDAEKISSGASAKRRSAEQACGDDEWNTASEQDESLGEVQASDN